MSKEKNTVELRDEKLEKVVGGSDSGMYSTASSAGQIRMKTSKGREIGDIGTYVTRTDSLEEFYVKSISNNCEPGDNDNIFSTTYCFSNKNGTSIFFFTAFKNGNVVCNDVK